MIFMHTYIIHICMHQLKRSFFSKLVNFVSYLNHKYAILNYMKHLHIQFDCGCKGTLCNRSASLLSLYHFLEFWEGGWEHTGG